MGGSAYLYSRSHTYTPRQVQICIITHNCIIAKNIFETSILASRYVCFANMLQIHISDTIMYTLAEINVSNIYSIFDTKLTCLVV